MRLALVDDRTGPALVAAQNRRGLVVFVAARIVDRAAARRSAARPAAACSWCPARSPGRRAVLEVAGCQGYVGARTGAAAAMAAVGERRVPRTTRAAGRAPGATALRPARVGAARCCRWRSRAALRSSPWPRSARCTGW